MLGVGPFGPETLPFRSTASNLFSKSLTSGDSSWLMSLWASPFGVKKPTFCLLAADIAPRAGRSSAARSLGRGAAGASGEIPGSAREPASEVLNILMNWSPGLVSPSSLKNPITTESSISFPGAVGSSDTRRSAAALFKAAIFCCGPSWACIMLRYLARTISFSVSCRSIATSITAQSCKFLSMLDIYSASDSRDGSCSLMARSFAVRGLGRALDPPDPTTNGVPEKADPSP